MPSDKQRIVLGIAALGLIASAAAAIHRRATVEVQELQTPIVEPSELPVNAPAVLRAGIQMLDGDLKRPKLQIFRDGKWRSFGKFRDDGKRGDLNAGDGVFSLRRPVLFAVSGTITFRVAARRKDPKQLVISPAVTLSVVATAPGTVALGSDLVLESPSDWEIQAKAEDNVELLSPAQRRLSEAGGVDVPSDITVRRVAKDAALPLPAFAQSFNGSWFSQYILSESRTFQSRAAIRFSDVGAPIGRSPVEAYFLELDATTVLVLTINDYETDRTPSLITEAEQILTSVTQ